MPDTPRTAMPPIALGTAQLGLSYGIANQAGKPDETAALALVRQALTLGIRAFDTAQAYGDSEAVLGRCLAACLPALAPREQITLISKLHPRVDLTDRLALDAAILESCRLLGSPPDALLLHHAATLSTWNARIERTLTEACAAHGIAALGVSVYTPDEFAAAIELDAMTFIQAPCNPWDRRLVEAPDLLDLAARRGKRLYFRSLFLQGLLLMEPDAAEARLPGCGPLIRRWRHLCDEYGRSPREACLDFGAGLPGSLVLGAESSRQVAENAQHRPAMPWTDWVAQLRRHLPMREVLPWCDPREWRVR